MKGQIEFCTRVVGMESVALDRVRAGRRDGDDRAAASCQSIYLAGA